MHHDLIGFGDHELFFEAKCFAKPIDHCLGIAVVESRNDLRFALSRVVAQTAMLHFRTMELLEKIGSGLSMFWYAVCSVPC